MKVAVITDQHFGVRNDSDFVYSYQKLFYDNVFFPELEKRGIKVLINGGDITDRRKYINYKTLHRFRNEYIERLEEMGIEQHNIIGNHDTFYKTTNAINSLQELFNDKPIERFHIYAEPTEIEIDGTKIALMPWIPKGCEPEALEFIDKTDAKILIGHLEVMGFKMYQNSIECDKGLPIDVFGKFDKVYSGHFHHQSKIKNIMYLGAPCQYTWSDYNDPRGFHILDTDTGEVEFIENPYRLFRKLYYDDSQMDSPVKKKRMIEEFKKEAHIYHGCYVKVIVKRKDDNSLYDKFLDILYEAEPADVKIIEEVAINFEDEVEDVDMTEDTMTLVKKHIHSLPHLNETQKTGLEKVMESLHEEALEMED